MHPTMSSLMEGMPESFTYSRECNPFELEEEG